MIKVAEPGMSPNEIDPDHLTLTSLTIFQQIAGQDRTAVKTYIDTNGSFVRALARKFNASAEEAEAATRDIFQDIWRYAKHSDKSSASEKGLIIILAGQRLIKSLPFKGNKNLWRWS